MKRGNTKARAKRGAVIGVVLFGALMLACVIGFWALCAIPGLPLWLFILFAVCGVLCAALILPALWALRKRFQEIDSLEDIYSETLYKEENIMLLVNIDYIPGKEFEVLGMAKGTVDEAEALGADAIVNIRYGSSAVMQGAAEVIAYGTAVRFK